jgi:DNA-binding transcriptional MerR regulator
MLTPSEVSAKLKIQPSTLRKYSALLEQEGIQFQRTHKNARLYTDSEYIAIEGIIATVHSGKKSLEEAVIEASKALKKNVSVAPRERDSDDIAAATLNEVKQLRIQLQQQEEHQKERDMMFVEVLEKMQRKIDVLEDHQKQLLAPVPEEPELNSSESSSQQPENEPKTITPKKDTRGLWARIWNK